MILGTIRSHCNRCKVLSKFVWGESRQDKGQSWFKAVVAFLYMRTSKERTNGHPPTPNNLFLYTLCLPPANHSSCFDVPSEYPAMILPNTTTNLINTTTPHHPTSQHLKPLPYHHKLYRHPLTTSLRHTRSSQYLRLYWTLIPSIHPILFLSPLQSITRNLSCDSIRHLVSRSSENIFQWSWRPWISSMKLPYRL